MTPMGDREQVRAHLRTLSEAGIGYRRVAELAGVSHKSVYRILVGQTRPTGRMADALLAVSVEVGPAERWPDATGTRRRLQALATLGWMMREVSELTTADESGLGQIIMNRAFVQRTTEAQVRRIYDDLSMRIPPVSYGSKRARLRAAKRGWFPPLAWPDDVIDDPTGLPCLLPPVVAVEPELELAVQHLAAGHDINIDAGVRAEFVRRTAEWPIAKVAAVVRCHVSTVTVLRRRFAC